MKVGVFDMGGAGWTGGLTYLRNLAQAVKTTIPEQLSLVLVQLAKTRLNCSGMVVLTACAPGSGDR